MYILPDDSQIYFCEAHTCLTEKLVKNLGDDYRIVIEQLHMNIQRQWSSRALLCFENHTGRLKTATLANLIN
jgi:hypothetical protein